MSKKEICELSEGIRSVIAGEDFDPRDNKEGVMSILKNDIYTLINLEKEQKSTAVKDRDHLAEYLEDVSHQLKTPITSMLLMVNLLEDAPEEKRAEFLFQIKKELAHMEWLTQALLKMAKLDSKAVELKKEMCQVKSLVEFASGSIDILLDIKNQKIQVVHDTAIMCNQKWTTEAIMNVLKNASECSPEGSLITVDSGENPIYYWISITDMGEGIPKERMASLFRRFENSQNENGYGIGLPLALSIIRNQNGDIEVKSGEKEKGTTFLIKFFK